MADTGTQTEGQEPDANNDASTETVETTSTEDQTSEVHQSEASESTDPWAGIPEDHWSRKEIESLRREAASRRTENRELKEKLSEAKSADEVQTLIDDYTAKLAKADLDLARATAARKHGLPDDLLELLTGETPEQIAERAEKLAPFVSKPKTPTPLTPTGGRDPREGSVEETPEQTYAKIAALKNRKF